MSISPEAFASVAASIERMELSMQHVVKTDDIKTVVSEAVEQATRKLGERQNLIEKEFADLKTEFQKFMKEVSSKPTQAQDHANRAKRSRSNDPSSSNDHEKSNTVAVVKGFPFPMWRARLISMAKEASDSLIPQHATHEYKAADNTSFVKVEFESRMHARAFIDSFKASPPDISLGGETYKLKAQFDLDPLTRARGWFLSQLRSQLEKNYTGSRSDWLRASAFKGEIIGDVGGSGRAYTLFKYEGEADMPSPVVENLAKIGVDETRAEAMISDVAARRRE
jgi:hypothetical protein